METFLTPVLYTDTIERDGQGCMLIPPHPTQQICTLDLFLFLLFCLLPESLYDLVVSNSKQ